MSIACNSLFLSLIKYNLSLSISIEFVKFNLLLNNMFGFMLFALLVILYGNISVVFIDMLCAFLILKYAPIYFSLVFNVSLNKKHKLK